MSVVGTVMDPVNSELSCGYNAKRSSGSNNVCYGGAIADEMLLTLRRICREGAWETLSVCLLSLNRLGRHRLEGGVRRAGLSHTKALSSSYRITEKQRDPGKATSNQFEEIPHKQNSHGSHAAPELFRGTRATSSRAFPRPRRLG